MVEKNKIFGGILLVSGTAIGAGMLALPLATAGSGFFYSSIAFVLCWFFMTLAALLLVEMNLRVPGDKDLISMVGITLGPLGKVITWVVYLLLLYALISAYFKGTSAWIVKIFIEHFQILLSPILAMSILAVIFSVVIFYGTAVTEKFNRYLALGLVVSYAILIAVALPSVELSQIKLGDISQVPPTLPLIITAFGFSVILPSLTQYLKRDSKALCTVVIVGSLIPLVIYLIWEWVTLGIVPMEGPNGLMALAAKHDDGTSVTHALEQIVGNPWITQSSQYFSIFVILTSLVGVSLALFHFLKDGLGVHSQKTPVRLGVLALTYLPPIGFLLVFPSGFGRILSFAGIFVAVLFGILPAVMVWISRSTEKQNPEPKFRVFGGYSLLIAVMAFFGYVVYLEILNCLPCHLQ